MHFSNEKEESHIDDVDPPWLFDAMISGDIANGLITDDTGHAGYSLFESLGIESIIGVAGFKSAEHFEHYSATVINANISDWIAVELELYECWLPCLNDQFPDLHYCTYGATEANFYEDQFCYSVWSQTRYPDAIIASKRKVFALRHKAYDESDRENIEHLHFVDLLHLARDKSYEQAFLHLQSNNNKT